MVKTIAIVGTLDTKGDEVDYVRELIWRRGHRVIVIDPGILGQAPFPPDITREQVAEAAGADLKELGALGDEATAIMTMAVGAAKIARGLYSSNTLDGIIALGGSMGTSLGAAVMKALPLTMPKLMVSTVAFTPLISGEAVGQDLTIMPTVVDLWGLNRITKSVLENAAGAIIGMVETYEKREVPEKPLIGVTTIGSAACKYASWVKPLLEDRGYEAAVFHANGIGGRTFEQFIEQGLLDGALDLCIFELVNHLCGGILAVEDRLEAMGKRAIPIVFTPGVLWLAGGPAESLPTQFKNRKIHPHNPLVTNVEATKDELIMVAKVIAQRLNKAIGPTILLLPTQGFSEPDRPWREYHNPEVRDAFMETLKGSIESKIEVIELNVHINDPEFAQEAVSIFDRLMKA